MKKINSSMKNNGILALFLIIAFAVSMIAIPTSSAHDPPQTYPTFAYVAVTPNPVGVGQSIYLIMWVSPNPPTALGVAGDRWRDFTVDVTKPNGDVVTLGTWDSDPTGSTFAVYTPDQIGTYKFDFKYPGQVMSQTGPTGLTADLDALKSRGTDIYIGDNFLASSATETLTVQQNPIEKIPDYPLPTTFWTRPIEGQNSGWESIASNWLGGAQIGARGNLWQAGSAPNSPHVMWTMPIETGGIVGGTTGVSNYAIPDVAFYSGGAYEGRLSQPLIIDGRLYFQMPMNHAGGSRSSGAGYICLDLRTGEQLWLNEELGVPYIGVFSGSDRPTIKGQLFDYESQNQHGVVGGTIWDVQGSTWNAFDAWTGNWIYTLTNVPSGTEAVTDMGAIVRYVLNYQDSTKSGWLALWNNTQHNVGLELSPAGSDPTTTDAYQWRPMGKTVDMSTAYTWNVTISADLSGLGPPSILNVIPGDIIVGTSSRFVRFFGTPDPYTIWAISDKPETRGQLLWIKNYSAPSGGVSRSFPGGNPIDTVNRVFFMQESETMAWLAYDLDTGNLKWGPVSGATRAFSYYGSGMGGSQQGFAAYGNLYVQGYGGELICYSGNDGSVLWKYNNTNSGIETVWGNYPIFIAAIADGKVYAFNNEHSPNYPLYKGERVRCIDAYTGQEVWTLLSWAGQIGGAGDETALLADGFLVYYNYYDNQVYCVGKGPSATTVTASPKITTKGSNVLIEGSVTDVSAGAKNKVSNGEFNVVPAVSDASMGPWMEYIYMQKPKPSDATGVQVHLTAIDPNGNYQDIGYVTSDSSGLFKKMWTPPIEGEYVITASFEGSNSYYGSSAETAFGVQAGASGSVVSPSPSNAIEPPATGAPTATYIAIGIAVVIIVAAAAVLVLRRRK
jgi:hypothetical protein